MRLANNSKEVLQSYFKKQTGAQFKIIDGNEEARLTFTSRKICFEKRKIKSEKFVLLDIGGGSTEIIVNAKDDSKAHSFNFGIVTLTQKYNDYEVLNKELQTHKKEIKNFFDTLENRCSYKRIYLCSNSWDTYYYCSN
ncbi:MAG: hypothetical protein ACNI3H_02545 [Halarcobacter ebronensis]